VTDAVLLACLLRQQKSCDAVLAVVHLLLTPYQLWVTSGSELSQVAGSTESVFLFLSCKS